MLVPPPVIAVIHQNLKLLYMKQSTMAKLNQMAKQMSSLEQVLLTLINIVNSFNLFSSSFPSSPCFRCIFSIPCVVVSCHTTEICVSEQQVTTENRTRINSCYLRELTLGKFIIQYEKITQMDNIGQGILLH